MQCAQFCLCANANATQDSFDGILLITIEVDDDDHERKERTGFLPSPISK